MNRQQHDQLLNESKLNAERAIIENVKEFHLEYAELSVTMREILASVYVRGGLDVLRKLKSAP